MNFEARVLQIIGAAVAEIGVSPQRPLSADAQRLITIVQRKSREPQPAFGGEDISLDR